MLQIKRTSKIPIINIMLNGAQRIGFQCFIKQSRQPFYLAEMKARLMITTLMNQFYYLNKSKNECTNR